jgi:hypothetical protein
MVFDYRNADADTTGKAAKDTVGGNQFWVSINFFDCEEVLIPRYTEET